MDKEIQEQEGLLKKAIEDLDRSISDLTQRYDTLTHNLTGGHAAPGESAMISEWEENIKRMTARRDWLKGVLDGSDQMEDQAIEEEKVA